MKLDNKPTQRLPYIDIAKAIALMLIVCIAIRQIATGKHT